MWFVTATPQVDKTLSPSATRLDTIAKLCKKRAESGRVRAVIILKQMFEFEWTLIGLEPNSIFLRLCIGPTKLDQKKVWKTTFILQNDYRNYALVSMFLFLNLDYYP